jgi:hypothetical protein
MIPSSQSSRASRRSPTPWNDKIVELQRVLAEPVVDLWRLRELALSEGGLVNGASVENATERLYSNVCCVRERLSASVLCIYLYMCVYVFT